MIYKRARHLFVALGSQRSSATNLDILKHRRAILGLQVFPPILSH